MVTLLQSVSSPLNSQRQAMFGRNGKGRHAGAAKREIR
jgi:hypothetical protein